jgi:hypothetical protein
MRLVLPSLSVVPLATAKAIHEAHTTCRETSGTMIAGCATSGERPFVVKVISEITLLSVM